MIRQRNLLAVLLSFPLVAAPLTASDLSALNPSRKGHIPSIHPDDLAWTKEEIAEYLSSGLSPDYDVAGGNMALVVENLSKLSHEDLLAIASYIKNVR